MRTVLVQGPSMLPTLRPGDCLLVRYGAEVRPGDLVVARPWTRPELLVVKRAVEAVAGWWPATTSRSPAGAGPAARPTCSRGWCCATGP